MSTVSKLLHPTLQALYATALAASEDLHLGSSVDDMIDSEYTRGQVELIAALVGLDSQSGNRDAIYSDLIARVCGINA